MNSNNKLSTYVVHYSKLVDRKKFLNQALPKINLEAEWVTENDTESFRTADIKSNKILGVFPKILGMDLGVNSRSLVVSRRKARIQGWILLIRSLLTPKNNTYSTGSLPKRIELPFHQLDIQRMHLTALKKGIKSGSDWILILEDDAIPTIEVNSILESILIKYKPHMTWMNLNSGANLGRTKSDPSPDKNGIFRVKPASTRCTVAYLVSKDLAEKIVTTIEIHGFPVWLPIDVVYQAALRKTRAKAYWQEPVSFLQGSEEGIYKSNLEGRRV